jgi:hypothetical protein
MTRQLYRISDQALLPYPRPDDEPVLGLDRNTYKVVEVVQLPEPQHDPATENLTPNENIDWLVDAPDATGKDGILYRSWSITPIDPPTPPEPAADWLGWTGWLYGYGPMADAMAAARASADQQGEPVTTGLPTAMNEARVNGNYAAFALSWSVFLAASAMPPTDLAEIIAKAQSCNLPAQFVAALQPSQPESNP